MNRPTTDQLRQLYGMGTVCGCGYCEACYMAWQESRREWAYDGPMPERKHAIECKCTGTGWRYALDPSGGLGLGVECHHVAMHIPISDSEWNFHDPEWVAGSYPEDGPSSCNCHGTGWTPNPDLYVLMEAVFERWPDAWWMVDKEGVSLSLTSGQIAAKIFPTLAECVEQALKAEGCEEAKDA